MPEIVVADVGHGNCALAIDNERIVMIDAGGPGAGALALLDFYGVKRIHKVVISHADDDHLGGLSTLLLDDSITIDQVILNADASKRTVGWQTFLRAVRAAIDRGTTFDIGATTQSVFDWGNGEFAFQFMAPFPDTALAGAGGQDIDGRPVRSNSLSIVVRIFHQGTPIVLLTGDIDELGLRDLLRNVEPPRARLLVYPHHGGLPATMTAEEFAARLCEAVRPSSVLFSVGRGRYGNPRQEVVDAVRAQITDGYVICTQLSEACAAKIPLSPPVHLNDRPARGKRNNWCCGGTIVLALNEQTALPITMRTGHSLFVTESAPTALCRRAIQPAAQPQLEV